MKRISAGTFAVALAAGAAFGTLPARADEVPEVDTPMVASSAWACLALDTVELGLCLDNPIPSTRHLPTVPELVDRVLGPKR